MERPDSVCMVDTDNKVAISPDDSRIYVGYKGEPFFSRGDLG